jgi:amino acid transporter
MAWPRSEQLAELLGYVALSAGMAVAASSYMVLGLIVRMHDLTALVLVIGLACAMCLLLALALGEMSSRFPSAPGIRTYLRRAFGERTSLFFTYLMMLIIPLVAAVEIKVFLAALLPHAPLSLQCLVASALVAALAWLNLHGHDVPRRVQTLVFGLLVLLSFFFSLLGLQAQTPLAAQLATPAPAASLALLAEGVGLSFFLFVGFEWVGPMARSPAAARSSVPWSMLLAVALLGLMYLAFGLALKHSLAPAVLASSAAPHVALGEQLLGSPGRWAAQALSLFALLTTLNAGLLGATRLVYGLAREQALGRRCSGWLAQLSAQGVPTRVVKLLAACSLLCALWIIAGDHAAAVASVGAGLYTLIYGVFAAAHVRLRRMPTSPPGFRTRVPLPLYPLLSLLAFAVAAATLLSAVDGKPGALLALLGFAAGALLMAQRVARAKGLQTVAMPARQPPIHPPEPQDRHDAATPVA